MLQKFSYIGVIFVLLPLTVATGLTMSPNLNAASAGCWSCSGGGSRPARFHFLSMAALVAFFVVHMVMVILAGPVNEGRSMITGRWIIEGDEQP